MCAWKHRCKTWKIILKNKTWKIIHVKSVHVRLVSNARYVFKIHMKLPFQFFGFLENVICAVLWPLYNEICFICINLIYLVTWLLIIVWTLFSIKTSSCNYLWIYYLLFTVLSSFCLSIVARHPFFQFSCQIICTLYY